MVWLLLALAVILAAEFVVQCIYVRLVLRIFETKPPFKVVDYRPDPDAELISFKTSDGLTLRGSIHHSTHEVSKGLILFCPELEGSHWSASTYGRGLLEAGFDILSFDFRNQGESDSLPKYSPLHWPTYHEVEDVRAAMRFIKSRPELNEMPLGVMGVSRGTIPAMIIAAECDQVKAVCLEGAYSTDSLMVHFISRWAEIYVPQFLLPILPVWHIRVTSALVRWTSQLRSGRNYAVLERWLPKLKNRDVLFIAGDRDNYVHPDVGRGLKSYINSKLVQFWLVKQAKHNRARNVNPIEYDHRVSEFFVNKVGTFAAIPRRMVKVSVG